MPRKWARTVSAVAVRSRWVRISSSRPSSPDSNSILPPSTSTAVSRSTTRATASSSPCTVARWIAAAAMVSAPAIAKRAETPERWSTGGGLAQLAGEAGQDLDEVVRHVGDQVGLLADHRDLGVELGRVVGADLGAEAVLERGDDAAAVGVVLGVGAGHHEDVERQPQHVAADLDVALLHHVEHRDLDPLGEVGQLVDRHDAAVAARDQAEVDGLRVTQGAALGDLHRVDVADQVGDRGVGGGQLLGVPVAAVAPLDRQVVALERRGARFDSTVIGSNGCSPRSEPAMTGVHSSSRPTMVRSSRVLPWPALAQQDDVVAGDQGPLELRDDGGLEAVEARPRVAALGQGAEEVVADLGAQGLGDVAGGAELADGRRSGSRGGSGGHHFTLLPPPTRG